MLIKDPHEGNYRLTIENADAHIDDTIFKKFQFTYASKQTKRYTFDVRLPFYELADNLFTQREIRFSQWIHIKCDFNAGERMKAYYIERDAENAINNLLMKNGTPADIENKPTEKNIQNR
jgi:hypothetical protein